VMVPDEIDRYSRLYRAVILLALQDAGAPPTREEKASCRNLRIETCSAIEYLFGCDRAVFDSHASLIGADPDQIRERLLSGEDSGAMRDAVLTPDRVRTLRIRHRWYQRAMGEMEGKQCASS